MNLNLNYTVCEQNLLKERGKSRIRIIIYNKRKNQQRRGISVYSYSIRNFECFFSKKYNDYLTSSLANPSSWCLVLMSHTATLPERHPAASRFISPGRRSNCREQTPEGSSVSQRRRIARRSNCTGKKNNFHQTISMKDFDRRGKHDEMTISTEVRLPA